MRSLRLQAGTPKPYTLNPAAAHAHAQRRPNAQIQYQHLKPETQIPKPKTKTLNPDVRTSDPRVQDAEVNLGQFGV